jgi:protein required for attachment to host cells
MGSKKIKTEAGDWIVVCDGRKALILENVGDHVYPDLRTKEVLEHESAPTHEQGADAPGRMFQSVGTARSSVEQTDWHDQDERAFLKGLADRLDAAVVNGETRNITLVAAPRALGMIRQEYSQAAKRAIAAEVAKDLVNQPVHEIEKQLVG